MLSLFFESLSNSIQVNNDDENESCPQQIKLALQHSTQNAFDDFDLNLNDNREEFNDNQLPKVNKTVNAEEECLVQQKVSTYDNDSSNKFFNCSSDENLCTTVINKKSEITNDNDITITNKLSKESPNLNNDKTVKSNSPSISLSPITNDYITLRRRSTFKSRNSLNELSILDNQNDFAKLCSTPFVQGKNIKPNFQSTTEESAINANMSIFNEIDQTLIRKTKKSKVKKKTGNMDNNNNTNNNTLDVTNKLEISITRQSLRPRKKRN